ncbi:MAG TPA: hypothetical protein VEA69_01930 [Tepidisphaeraceae bacterium]|nr:hypothetical protein [Tepidisphaeraceae bacterium]
MGFDSGSITFRRFAVVGELAANQPDEKLLERMAEHALVPGEFGVEESEYGWNAGRHIYDTEFSFDNNVYNDCLWFALRIDTNKVPGDVKKAYTLQEEAALAKKNPSGFLSKAQKKEAKEAVQQRIDEDLKSGRFRRSKLVNLLWDVPAGIVYSAASGANFEKLAEIFERSFKCELQPLSAGSLAARVLVDRGKRREYEDAKPTRFAFGPDGESQAPEYPWTAKGPQPKDFMGNEFLLWLWFHADAKDGEVVTESMGDVALLFDKTLDLDCSFGMTGRDTLKASGPTRMPEARDALRTGKVPRKAFLTIHAKGNQFEFNFNPEQMSLGSAKLPEIEDAETPRQLFEERITLLRDLSKTLDALYETFLTIRAGAGWEGQTGQMRKWILSNAPKPQMAVA